MDTGLLKTFLAIARQRSFSKAAAELHRTQPAISRRIGLLERELGVPLFERGGGELVLSQAGRVLLPFAERALAAIRDAEDAVRDLRQPNAGPLSLGDRWHAGRPRPVGAAEALRDKASKGRDILAHRAQHRSQ
jgi:DNA-binding transcriptional LysR family regulator